MFHCEKNDSASAGNTISEVFIDNYCLTNQTAVAYETCNKMNVSYFHFFFSECEYPHGTLPALNFLIYLAVHVFANSRGSAYLSKYETKTG